MISEVEKFGKFDDLVIFYDEFMSLLQAKHTSINQSFSKTDFKKKN